MKLLASSRREHCTTKVFKIQRSKALLVRIPKDKDKLFNLFDANGKSHPLLVRTVSYFDSPVRSLLVHTSPCPIFLLQYTHRLWGFNGLLSNCYSALLTL